jgi:hypothetical protein
MIITICVIFTILTIIVGIAILHYKKTEKKAH